MPTNNNNNNTNNNNNNTNNNNNNTNNNNNETTDSTSSYDKVYDLSQDDLNNLINDQQKTFTADSVNMRLLGIPY